MKKCCWFNQSEINKSGVVCLSFSFLIRDAIEKYGKWMDQLTCIQRNFLQIVERGYRNRVQEHYSFGFEVFSKKCSSKLRFLKVVIYKIM